MGNQTNTPREWRLLAERDMSVANHLAATMRPAPAEAVAFHCQQATEKYLKGALVILGEEPPYIHFDKYRYKFNLGNPELDHIPGGKPFSQNPCQNRLGKRFGLFQGRSIRGPGVRGFQLCWL